ncbi:MAG: hypothetical protein EHM36_10940 [Deltaproteobacteria bacterium]|nr:MAG: hypothetical protein EHM36_10940 [Deltaproteobacteria bacterium]
MASSLEAVLMAYSKTQQNMDLKWQIARKLDRLDLGTFAATEFFYRVAIIYGLVRAIDPEEKRNEDDPASKDEKTIPQLMGSVDARIKVLLATDTTALILGKLHLEEAREFQNKTMSAYYELIEIIARCKLIENVRTAGEEI